MTPLRGVRRVPSSQQSYPSRYASLSLHGSTSALTNAWLRHLSVPDCVSRSNVIALSLCSNAP